LRPLPAESAAVRAPLEGRPRHENRDAAFSQSQSRVRARLFD
jgi:hypothetical protein